MSNKRSNRLRLVRMRLGYEQKQIVHLLGHKVTSLFSRLETGQKIPSLKVAVKLSILYRLPIRILFNAYYDECRRELNNRTDNLKQKPSFSIDITEPTDYCSYVEMMNASFVTDIDKAKIKRHAIQLLGERRDKILDH